MLENVKIIREEQNNPFFDTNAGGKSNGGNYDQPFVEYSFTRNGKEYICVVDDNSCGDFGRRIDVTVYDCKDKETIYSYDCDFVSGNDDENCMQNPYKFDDDFLKDIEDLTGFTLISEKDLKKDNFETTEKEEQKIEKSENMKGYGKEVYITESDDVYKEIINGKEYEIETYSYYDDETGNSNFKIAIKDKKNNEKVYEYSEYSDLDNYDEECYQNTNVINDEILKELSKSFDKKLPTQEEIENKYSKKEVKIKKIDKEESKLQQLKDYLTNATNIENEVEKLTNKMEEIVEKYDLKNDLPIFKIITENGISFSSDKGSISYQDKDGNMLSESSKLFDQIKGAMGEEYLDNMDMFDIRDWQDFKNKNDNTNITIVYESFANEGDYLLKEYSDFNSYAKETIKPLLVQEILNKPERLDELKQEFSKENDKIKNIEKDKIKEEKEVSKNEIKMDF